MNLRSKRVLVTGAAGFVGRHLCRALHREGAETIGLRRDSSPPIDGADAEHLADICDQAVVSSLVRTIQPDVVIHLAASKQRDASSAESVYDTVQTNVIGTVNLVDACMKLPRLTRFVSMGTCEEYGVRPTPFREIDREAPTTAYGASKAAATQLLLGLSRGHGFPVVVLRPSVAYGPGQNTDMFIPALVSALVSGQRFPMTDGSQTRDFVYVEDLVDALLLASDADTCLGHVINISSASSIRIATLARKVAQLIGSDSERLLEIGALPHRSGGAAEYEADNSLARTLLGWSPQVSLHDGLRQTIAHYATAGAAS